MEELGLVENLHAYDKVAETWWSFKSFTTQAILWFPTQAITLFHSMIQNVPM